MAQQKPSFPRDYFRLKGKTAERIVHELAAKTFLIDWCFLNPKLPDGKELCDLLVIFDDIAIIWQVKDLKLDKNGTYKKSEVEKNLRQLSGARRQLFDLKTPIELENSRRRKEHFDPNVVKKVYLIAVLLGEGEESFSFAEEIKRHTAHIFTKDFTQTILNELDTISDFAEYLKAKEELLNTGKSFIILGGEEELLAIYLMDDRRFDRFNKFDCVVVQDGSWEHLQDRPEYRNKKKADEISYGWDSIINRTHAHEGSENYELVARELARPNRFQRRYLSKVFIEAHIKAHNERTHDLFRRMVQSDGVTYCFLFQDDPEPREKRTAMLAAICRVARGKFQQNKTVLGIATEMKIRPACSYDFCLMYLPEWTEEDQRNMEQLQKVTGIFVNPVISHVHEDEYPQKGESGRIES
ncbi:MAG: hypothetical protein Q7T26_04975 [Dehalococcoidia bacterium]|nr:hypothetical protein [Dehalococcoidia bacterium]